jgi:large subunit ribosomal protein L21
VVGIVQGKKIYVQKFARRKNYRRRTGHRSISTTVRIASIG